jgi:hypothetical protein
MTQTSAGPQWRVFFLGVQGEKQFNNQCPSGTNTRYKMFSRHLNIRIGLNCRLDFIKWYCIKKFCENCLLKHYRHFIYLADEFSGREWGPSGNWKLWKSLQQEVLFFYIQTMHQIAVFQTGIVFRPTQIY